MKNIPKNYYKVCDFYYDTWRPVLFWYATAIDQAYKSLGENRRYNNPPTLLEALTELDKRFYEPENLKALENAGFISHPVIKHMQNIHPGRK